MIEIKPAEMGELMKVPGFRKFLFNAIQLSGIWSATANGADGRDLFREGRRSLGLDILHQAATALPSAVDPESRMLLTLNRVIDEASNQPAPEHHENERYERDD